MISGAAFSADAAGVRAVHTPKIGGPRRDPQARSRSADRSAPVRRLAEPVNVRLSLFLPRDSASVPMARRILATTLGTVGVTDECRADILLALAEACANAVAHAQPADSYEITIQIDQELCLIEVVDAGHGFDVATLPNGPSSDPLALDEAGRGLQIIRALSDQFDLRRNDPTGTLVRFAKRLDRPA
jgi:serine/threonine-protein kinase RsbW